MTEQENLTLGTKGGQSYSRDTDLTFADLANVIWKGKWICLLITLMFALASFVYAISLPNIYKATALLRPASQSGGGSLAALSGQFGGLASLAGVSLGEGDIRKEVIAQELIQSWGFIEKFISSRDIAPQVFAVVGWDPQSKRLSYDRALYDIGSQSWTREEDRSNQKFSKPSSWELYEVFRENMLIAQNKKTGLITLSIEHYSPEIAANWVQEIIVDINRYMRDQDIAEAKANISFLNEQIENTSISEMQAVFYRLIEEQTKTLMLAQASNEYVLKTISKAKVPEEKSRPMRAIICILVTFVGWLISITYLLIRHLAASRG